jgi:hypothetical protein
LVASKPAGVRLFNPPRGPAGMVSAVALGASVATSRRHCPFALISGAASRLSSCCWKTWAARPS